MFGLSSNSKVSSGGTLDVPTKFRKTWTPIMGVKDILQEFVKEFPSSGAQVDMKATQRHYTLEDWKAAMCRQLKYASPSLL